MSEEETFDPRDEVSKQAGWAAVGFIACASACGELRIPLGVFTLCQEAHALARAWMSSTPNALRTEVKRIHEPVLGED